MQRSVCNTLAQHAAPARGTAATEKIGAQRDIATDATSPNVGRQQGVTVGADTQDTHNRANSKGAEAPPATMVFDCDAFARDFTALEQTSTSTWTNALNSLRVAQERGWSDLVVVTNGFHQWRALRSFWKASFAVPPPPGRSWRIVAAAPHERDVPLLNDGVTSVYNVWREVAACAYYWFRGYI